MSSHHIHHLLDVYGLAVVFVALGLQALCLPVPGGTVLAAAAVYASSGHGLSLAGVLVAGALGGFSGMALAFLLGRWRGVEVLLRVGRIARQRPERIEELRQRFAENAVLVLFVGRFITGVRNVIGLAAGTSGMPAAKFVIVSAAAATLSSAIISVEYYFFGHTFLGAATWIQVLLVVIGIVATVVMLGMARKGARPAPPGSTQPSE